MKNKYFLFIALLLFFSCSQIEKEEDAISTIRPLLSTNVVTDFSKIVIEIEQIPLESTKKSLIADVSKMQITKSGDYVVLNTSSILLFNSKGQFIHTIGKMGKGPGEYTKIYDICIEDNEETLLALDCNNRVFRYSLRDSSFYQLIMPKWDKQMKTCDGICSSENGGFYLFCSNPIDVDNFENDFNCLYNFDSNGELLNESMLRQDLTLSPERFTKSYDGSYLMRPLEGDWKLIQINGNNIKTYYKIDFGELGIPKRYVYNFSGSGFQNIPKLIKSSFYKLPMSFFETAELIYFKSAGPQGKTNEFIIRKKNKCGIHWIHSDKSPFTFVASDKNYFYCLLNDSESTKEFNKNNKEVNPLKSYVLDNYKIKKQQQFNPTIVKIRFNLCNK